MASDFCDDTTGEYKHPNHLARELDRAEHAEAFGISETSELLSTRSDAFFVYNPLSTSWSSVQANPWPPPSSLRADMVDPAVAGAAALALPQGWPVQHSF